jgi:hypothetical protein
VDEIHEIYVYSQATKKKNRSGEEKRQKTKKQNKN